MKWRNVSLQIIHLGVGGVLYMGLWLVLARSWGANLFGTFNFLYAYVAMWGIFFDFGLDLLLTRYISAHGRGIPLSLLKIKAGVILAGCFFSMGLAVFFNFTYMHALAFLLAGIILLSATNFINGFLRGVERLDIEAGVSLAQKIVFVGMAVSGVLGFKRGVGWVSLSYLTSHMMGFCVTFFFAAARPEFSLLKKALPSVKESLKISLPFWMVALLTTLGQRSDIFMLKILTTEKEVGLYSAGFRIIEGLIFFEVAYIAAFFPRLVQLIENKGAYRSIVKHSGFLLLSGALAIAVAAYFLAPWGIPFLFGGDYAESIKVLQHLGLSLPLVFVSALFGHLLIAWNRQLHFVAALAVALCVNFAVDMTLIPKIAISGAVFGFWSREIVLSVILYTMVRRFAGRD